MVRKENRLPLLAGSLFVLILAVILQLPHDRFSLVLGFFQNVSYDLMVRHFYTPPEKETPILIVDIDDASIEYEGRWPWNRGRMEVLISKLDLLGAKTIALDIVFSEKEPNLALQVAERLKALAPRESRGAIQELESIGPQFDDDLRLADAFGKANTVLGFALTKSGTQIGALPPPLLQMRADLKEDLLVPSREGYIANISLFQQKAKGGGFLNSRGDLDGVVRFSPLLYRRGNALYPSLSLAALERFLPKASVELIIADYGKQKVLEGIQVGERMIPTNPWGEILVPFRGPPYSLPYISATNVFQGKVSRSEIEGKLVFIGSSATFMGDLVSSAISPVFPGIEIHAQIAASILDGYMPYKPGWIRGAMVAELLFAGMGFALLLPFVNPGVGLILVVAMALSLFGFDYFLWVHHGIVYSSIFTISTLFILLGFNSIYEFFVERKKELFFKSMFSYYIPKERVERMAEREEAYSLEGETKDLTVLFADIRQFTTLSERFSAPELKVFLNRFLSEMTTVIFANKGTIDKYIGDLVMAFWGAPIDDPTHELNGVIAALQMQKKLKGLSWGPTYPQIQIGIGVNSGLMNVGDMGSTFRRAYTVLGAAVNIGSRLESATKYYKVDILAGEATYQKTKEAILYRPIDRVQFVGSLKGTMIFEPLCLMNESTEELKSKVALHEEALNAYFSQHWDLAEKLFSQLKGADPLYELFLSRIASFRNHPPKSEWGGIYELTSK